MASSIVRASWFHFMDLFFPPQTILGDSTFSREGDPGEPGCRVWAASRMGRDGFTASPFKMSKLPFSIMLSEKPKYRL